MSYVGSMSSLGISTLGDERQSLNASHKDVALDTVLILRLRDHVDRVELDRSALGRVWPFGRTCKRSYSEVRREVEEAFHSLREGSILLFM